MTAIKFDLPHYGETTEVLRQNGVSFENKATDWSRESLCGLFSGTINVGDMDATLIAILKPKKPNGKAGDSRSSLRYAKGGDAIRKTADSVEDIFTAATSGAVAEAFRPIAIAFATAADNSPKSLAAVRGELSKLRSEAAKVAKAAADNAGNTADADNETPKPVQVQVPLAVMAERMALALREASADDVLAADDQLTALMSALRDAYSAPVEQQQAA